MYADYYEDFVEDVYLEDDGYGYWNDEEAYDQYEEGFYGEEDYYYEGYDDYEIDEEEDVPEDLNRAYGKTEEAYIGYLDARKKMRELANNRGFYPAMAIGPDFDSPRERNYTAPRPKGKGKGRGKSAPRLSKGRGESQGKGKGK